MKRSTIRYTLAALVIIGATFYLIAGNLKDSSHYYITVEEFLALENLQANRTLRLTGRVLPGSFKKQGAGIRYEFKVGDVSKNVTVIYEGAVPDAFKEGREVVVTGRRTDDGTFHSKEMLTRCPSKYGTDE